MLRFLSILGFFLLLLASCQAQAQVPHHRHVKHGVSKHHVHHAVHHRVAAHHHSQALPPVPLDYSVPYVSSAGLSMTYVAVDAESVRCMANVILYEARGEPVRGQIAVANVVMNRTKLPQYAPSVCGVVRQSTRIKGKRYCQFSWQCQRPRVVIKPELRRHAEHLAKLAIQGRLPNVAGKATSFHATYVRVRSCGRPLTIGRHVFCTDTRYLAEARHDPHRLSEPTASL